VLYPSINVLTTGAKRKSNWAICTIKCRSWSET